MIFVRPLSDPPPGDFENKGALSENGFLYLSYGRRAFTQVGKPKRNREEEEART
jgi:hypothetical protein